MMMMMMTNMVLRAPILTLALASLFLNGRVVMAQFDTGKLVRTALDTTTAPPRAQVIFYHESVASATPAGSYDVDFYYTGCDDRMPLNDATKGITLVSQTAVPDAAVDLGSLDIGFNNQCGVNDNAACGRKTTYSFIVEQLNQITDNRIKTVGPAATGTTTTVKFCIRHRMLNSNGVEMAYREAEVTASWDTNGNFAGTIATTNDAADNPTLDVGDVSVTVVPCSNIAVAVPTSYEQGELIQLCLYAEHTGATPVAEVTIVKVDSLRFWIDFGTDNNVYENGETTQLGMVNGLPVGTTTIIPAGAGVGATVCNRVFFNVAGTSSAFVGAGLASTTKGCVLSTLLTPAFFVDTTVVDFAGSVTIEFGDGSTRRRRVLSLRGDHQHHRSVQQVKVGDQFNKSYTSTVTTTSANNNSSTCSCSGFFLFKIICWIFKCLLGFN